MSPPTAGHMLLLEELARGHDGEPLPGPTKESALARGLVAHTLDGQMALTDAGREVLGATRAQLLALQGAIARDEGHTPTAVVEVAVRRALSLGQIRWSAAPDDDLPGAQLRALLDAGVLINPEPDPDAIEVVARAIDSSISEFVTLRGDDEHHLEADPREAARIAVEALIDAGVITRGGGR